MKIFTTTFFILSMGMALMPQEGQCFSASTAQTSRAAFIGTGYITAAPFLTSKTSQRDLKEAAERLQEEVQEYNASGVMGIYLAAQVDMLRADSDLSDKESIDLLLEASHNILLRHPSND